MNTSAIRLNERLIKEAKIEAKVMRRSAAGQIEYWAKIGRTLEANPDLPFSFVKDTLFAIEDVKAGRLDDYPLDNEE